LSGDPGTQITCEQSGENGVYENQGRSCCERLSTTTATRPTRRSGTKDEENEGTNTDVLLVDPAGFHASVEQFACHDPYLPLVLDDCQNVVRLNSHDFLYSGMGQASK
jgi:hypothetical protein